MNDLRRTGFPVLQLTDLSVTLILAAFLAAPIAAAADTPVRTVQVETVPGGQASVRATGTLAPRHELQVAFAVGGVVRDILVEDGEPVAEGDAIASLDLVPFQAALDQARSRVEFLSGRVRRSEELLAANAISAEEFEADRSQLRAAEAEVELARWNLDRATLRAPFDGRVVRTHLEPGQVIGAGTAAAHLIDAGELELRASVPARAVGAIPEAATFEVRAVADPRLTAPGRLHHRPFVGDERSGAVPLLIIVDNADGRLLPGLVVECEIADGVSGPELRIPLSALQVEAEGNAVWVVESGRVTRNAVVTGAIRGDEVVILEGLRDGQTIVDRAPDRLREGDPVTTGAPEVRR
jgi:membrane fusion protein (multidrug efflux system)